MRILKFLGGAVALLVAAAGLVALVLPLFQSKIEPLVLRERWALRWQALDVADQSLGLAEDSGWTAMAGINDAAIDAAFTAVEGAVLQYDGEGILQGATITVEGIDVSPGIGAMDAAVALTARRGSLTLGLRLEGAILVNAIENGTRKVTANGVTRDVRTSEVTLRIDPVSLALSSDPATLERDQKGFWADIAPGLANAALPDRMLSVKFPLQAEFLQQIGLDEERTTVLDETSGASVTYHLSMPQNEFSVGLAYGAPVYTGSAVWLMARDVSEAPPDIRPRDLPDGGTEVLEAAALALNEDIQGRLAPVQHTLEGIDEPRITLAVDNRLLSSLRSAILSLPEDGRRVTARLRNRSGKLAEKEWSDDILGKGGSYVEIGCPDCGMLEAQLHDLSFETTGEVWRAQASLSAQANGNLHAHFDPLIGGGNGTSLRVEGATGGAQSVGLDVRARILADDAGHRISVLSVQPGCNRLEIIATTDGRLKFDLGWISMPRVGARLFMPVSTKPVEPVLMMASAPIYLYWDSLQRAAESDEDGSWTLLMPNLATILSVTPAEFSLQDGQMRASVDVSVRHVAAPIDPEAHAAARVALEAEERQAVVAALEAIARLLEQAREENLCQEVKPGIRVLIGDIEIGPNNELIKFLQNAWNDITLGPGTGNEIVKLLDGAGEVFHQAEAIRRGLMEGVLDDAGKVLAYGSDEFNKWKDKLNPGIPIPDLPDIPLPKPPSIPLPKPSDIPLPSVPKVKW